MKLLKSAAFSILFLAAEMATTAHGATLRGRALKKKRIKLDEVPVKIYRQAAQLLEEYRNTDGAPGWDDTATIINCVKTLLRPDVDGVAYYEFKVNVVNNDSSDDADGSSDDKSKSDDDDDSSDKSKSDDDERRAGFIIASAGPFDFPISNWNFKGLSPTEKLDEIADKKHIKSYYKLDTLSYAGENASGKLVANIGGLPPDIEGLTLDTASNVLENPEAGVECEVAASEETPESDLESSDSDSKSSDDDDDDSGHRVLCSGGSGNCNEGNGHEWTIPESKCSPEEGWEKHKENFAVTYEVPLRSLANDAEEDWVTETLADDLGEGLVVGEPYKVALLYELDTFHLSRDCISSYVDVEEIETPGHNVLVLTVIDAPDEDTLEFDLVLEYENKKTETKKFVIVPKAALEEFENDEERGEGRMLSNVHWADGARGLWSPWDDTYAGTRNDQRLYEQIPSGESPNNSGCQSGCGATAWAMLIGWADYKASQPNSGWNHRSDLYRENGGTGSDAVAPKSMDTGVKNMIWEIRNLIGTFCWGDSGATFPWEMKNAKYYLQSRSGVGWRISWNSLGIRTSGLTYKARDSIRDRKTPVIIGTGWLEHYPLAYGYAYRKRRVRKCFLWWCWTDTQTQRAFYVNNGWGGGDDNEEWVSASTWFAGTLIP